MGEFIEKLNRKISNAFCCLSCICKTMRPSVSTNFLLSFVLTSNERRSLGQVLYAFGRFVSQRPRWALAICPQSRTQHYTQKARCLLFHRRSQSQSATNFYPAKAFHTQLESPSAAVLSSLKTSLKIPRTLTEKLFSAILSVYLKGGSSSRATTSLCRRIIV